MAKRIIRTRTEEDRVDTEWMGLYANFRPRVGSLICIVQSKKAAKILNYKKLVEKYKGTQKEKPYRNLVYKEQVANLTAFKYYYEQISKLP